VLELGRERSRLRETGGVFPAEREAEWRELGAPLFERVRSFFGGRVRMATSGGALLPVEVTEYLDALGLTVLGAYGLTEHLCVAFNQPARYAFHSVGPVMPGSEIRIAEDGEILVRRGALTFSGYHGRMELTGEAFTPDGEWLCTGDLGVLDDSGFLHVTGRKKELSRSRPARRWRPPRSRRGSSSIPGSRRRCCTVRTGSSSPRSSRCGPPSWRHGHAAPASRSTR